MIGTDVANRAKYGLANSQAIWAGKEKLIHRDGAAIDRVLEHLDLALQELSCIEIYMGNMFQVLKQVLMK